MSDDTQPSDESEDIVDPPIHMAQARICDLADSPVTIDDSTLSELS